EIHPIGGGDPVTAQLGDLSITDLEWTPEGVLLVAGDLHSSGAVLAVDPATGEARSVASGGVFSSLAAAPAVTCSPCAATSPHRPGRCGSRPTAPSPSCPPRARWVRCRAPW